MKRVTGDRPGWSATFSRDELLRYTLTRPIVPPEFLKDLAMAPQREESKARAMAARERFARSPFGGYEGGRRLVSCGLNPSTADAFKNDSTVTLELVHGWIWHCSWYMKINAYAWRDTHPKNMFAAQKSGRDIVGVPENDDVIGDALMIVRSSGGIALAAWGALVDKQRQQRLKDIARDVGVQWMSFGLNQDGSPKHTLRQPYGVELVPWP